MSKQIYIISGCNGAGKTTASFSILPDLLNCKEFVNADEIARGISPFNPENVSIEAGRIMLERINDLMNKGITFAFETTLSTKSFRAKLIRAKELGYKITLLFFWLESIELAYQRVELRVKQGGHNIPKDTIERRYKRGIINLFDIYSKLVDEYILIDNSGSKYEVISHYENGLSKMKNEIKFNIILDKYGNYKK